VCICVLGFKYLLDDDELVIGTKNDPYVTQGRYILPVTTATQSHKEAFDREREWCEMLSCGNGINDRYALHSLYQHRAHEYDDNGNITTYATYRIYSHKVNEVGTMEGADRGLFAKILLRVGAVVMIQLVIILVVTANI
jgi:hypothetical protein